METLSQFGNIPIDISVLKSLFAAYTKPTNKIEAMVKDGTLVRLKRGLFVVSPKISGQLLSTELIANHIYGPSYVSMESALRYYGLIPESVYLTRSMTIKRSKEFKNTLGTFDYIQCSEDYYSIGVRQEQSGEATFLIASPEKALCDMIVYTSKLRPRFIKAMEVYLEDDLRFDMDELQNFDIEILSACAEVGKKRNEIKNLIKIIERLK
ncbi:MAG: hypothetical protein SNH27_10995 [Rikenellaceae bacterium]